VELGEKGKKQQRKGKIAVVETIVRCFVVGLLWIGRAEKKLAAQSRENGGSGGL
jgi:hypothetical protein